MLVRYACQQYVSKPKRACWPPASQNEPKIVGVAWFLDQSGSWIGEVDELQADLDRCRVRLLGGSEQAELRSVLTLVVGRHIFEHAVKDDRELAGHMSERGSR